MNLPFKHTHIAEGLFTPLEMMPRSSCFAVPPTAGLGPNIIPAGFDTPLGFES